MKVKEARRLLAGRERRREKLAEAERRAADAQGIREAEVTEVEHLFSIAQANSLRALELEEQASAARVALRRSEDRLGVARGCAETADDVLRVARARVEVERAAVADPKFAAAEQRIAAAEEHAKREAVRLQGESAPLSPEAAKGLAFLRSVFSYRGTSFLKKETKS